MQALHLKSAQKNKQMKILREKCQKPAETKNILSATFNKILQKSFKLNRKRAPLPQN